MLVALASALTLGLASSAHCAAMCGPLVVAGCRGAGAGSRRAALGYFVGRALSYSAGGALAGAMGAPLVDRAWSLGVRRAAAALVATALLAAVVRWLYPRAVPRGLVPLARGGPTLATRWLRALASVVPTRGVALGLATGVFPCGALLAALMAAAASASAATGALMMLAYSAASAPLLIAALVAGERAARALPARLGAARPVLAGVAVVVAAWIAVAPWVAKPAAAAQGCECETQAH